jgi:glutamyl-tRNA reductase
MDIYAIGASHKHSPVEIREQLAFNEDELRPALLDLCRELATEAAIISTCNRTEIYVVPQGKEFQADRLKEWLRHWKGTNVSNAHLFSLHGAAAAKHLMDVASAVDSQVIGDLQIIGQVRDAYQKAQQAGSLGKLLSRLFSSALHTGKRVKSETDLFSGAVSVSYVAVELARKIFYPLADKRTLVVGAGETGELTVQNLRAQGVGNVTITNRTEAHGRDLIERLGFGTWMPLEELPSRLHEFDIVIVSTGAPNYLITYDHARSSSSRRAGDTQLIVDISVPRNVEPRVSSLPNVFCKDINDLNGVIESNVEKRRAELPHAEMIIAEELAKFSAWCNLLPVTPVVAQLKQQSDEIMRAELEKNRHRFGEAEFEHVEKLVASVVRKIIGMPMAHLLDAQNDLQHALVKAEYVKLLFNLHGLENCGAAEVGMPDDEGEERIEIRNGNGNANGHPNGHVNGVARNGDARHKVRYNA